MAFVYSVISGLVASVAFFLLLTRIKPQLDLSPVVARRKNRQGEWCYSFKVINRGAPLVNIRAELHRIRRESVNGRGLVRSRRFELIRDDPMTIDRYDPDDPSIAYTYVFTTAKGQYVDTSLARYPDSELRFRLTAMHEVSQITRIFKKTYRADGNDIRDGRFQVGDTFDITAATATTAVVDMAEDDD